MPFKSKAQVRKFHALKSQGKMDQATIDQWAGETRVPIKKLPERVKKACLEKLSFYDRIPGGKADNRQPEDFDPNELARGVKIEMEHTRDPERAEEIAMDHLMEHKDYYEDLEEAEEAMKEEDRTGREAEWHIGNKKEASFQKSFEKEAFALPSFLRSIGGAIIGPRNPFFEGDTVSDFLGGSEEDLREGDEDEGDDEDQYEQGFQNAEALGEPLYTGPALKIATQVLKLAGGPGSGVSGDNTDDIDILETSPLMSIHYRKKFMENTSPVQTEVLIPSDRVKYKCQEKYVPKKLIHIVQNAGEALQKPVDVILDEEGYYHIMDGHHRGLAALILDKPHMKANVYVIGSGEKTLQQKTAEKKSSFKDAFVREAIQPQADEQLQIMWGYNKPTAHQKEREGLIPSVGVPDTIL